MTRGVMMGVLTVVLAGTVLLSPWKRDLYVGDETKYGQVIREMHSSDRILLPLLNGSPYSHKPPLHFWFIYALTVLASTTTLWPYVIPSIVGYVALLLIIRLMARELFDEDPGWMPSILFGSFYLIWGLAQTARMDLEFTALIGIAVLCLFRLFRDGDARQPLWAGIAVGVAILIKGPMAFVMVLMLMILEGLRRRRLPKGAYLTGIAVAALIPLLWLIPAIMQGGGDYARELLIKQNIDRAVGSWVHRAPPWFYLVRFPLTFFPWFMLVIAAFVALFRRSYSERDRESLRFSLSWFLAVLIPFSLISSKLDIYMVPAMVPASLIAAHFVNSTVRDRWTRVGAMGNLVVLSLLGVGAVSALFMRPGLMARSAEYAALGGGLVTALLVLTAIISLVAIVAVLVSRQRLLASTVALLITSLFPLVFAAAALIPLANRFGSTAPLIASLDRLNVPGERIALFRSPYLWSRNMPASFAHVQYIGSDAAVSDKFTTQPLIVAAQSDKVQQLGEEFIRRYVKIDQVRMKGKTFDVYRRR
ncbi:MAG: glycosyltransferase family 39 protein [Acidobacteriota bacterium]